MNVFNQFSYVLISSAVLIASLIVLRRYNVDRRLMSAVGIAIVVLSVSAALILRPGLSDVDSLQMAQATFRNGKPTLLEFFSNYCAGCLAVRPAVDLLAAEFEEDINIVRIDIHTDFGREIRQEFGFSYTPEFILLDHNGQEIWREHVLPTREQVIAIVLNAAAP
jgi:thiol-disulfide isomerase/thioredoxin